VAANVCNTRWGTTSGAQASGEDQHVQIAEQNRHGVAFAESVWAKIAPSHTPMRVDERWRVRGASPAELPGGGQLSGAPVT
jgi:hypothetical protein